MKRDWICVISAFGENVSNAIIHHRTKEFDVCCSMQLYSHFRQFINSIRLRLKNGISTALGNIKSHQKFRNDRLNWMLISIPLAAIVHLLLHSSLSFVGGRRPSVCHSQYFVHVKRRSFVMAARLFDVMRFHSAFESARDATTWLYRIASIVCWLCYFFLWIFPSPFFISMQWRVRNGFFPLLN